MILVALGSNVTGPWGTPRETVSRALAELDKLPLRLVVASSLISTKPFGVVDQPDFINAVAQVETRLQPEALLERLHAIEHLADRRRGLRWGPRTLDLDILDFHGLKQGNSSDGSDVLRLPHPGIAERDFVLGPIAEIAPDWRHPETGLTAYAMLQALQQR